MTRMQFVTADAAGESVAVTAEPTDDGILIVSQGVKEPDRVQELRIEWEDVPDFCQVIERLYDQHRATEPPHGPAMVPPMGDRADH